MSVTEKEAGKAALRMMREQLNGVSRVNPLDRATGPVDDEQSRLRRYIDLLEGHLHRSRERATRFEIALAEIASSTRKLKGDTTTKVYELAIEALSIDDDDDEAIPTESTETKPFE